MANRERRYWRDFATEDAARDFADRVAKEEGGHSSHAVLVRTCQTGKG
jgi:hypothetical protein